MQALGRRVPEDVSVIGFDNWDVMVHATRPQHPCQLVIRDSTGPHRPTA